MNKLKFIFALTAAFCISVAASAQAVGDVNAKFKEAVEFITAKQYDKAIPALEATIEMGLDAGPDASGMVDQAQKLLPDCYLRLGMALCGAGNLEEGIVNLTQAVELGELYNTNAARRAGEAIAQAYLMMGDKAFKAKEYAKAIEIFSKGYEVAPTNTQLAMYLAQSYAESGDLNNGLKIYNDVVALEGRHSRYKEAAAEARVNITYYLNNHIKELTGSGRMDEAYQVLGDILAADPANADIHLIRIQTATNASQWNRVIEWGEEAAAAQSTPERQSDIYFFLGAAHQNSDNVPAAITAYEKVVAGANVAKAKEQIGLLKNLPTK